MSESGPEQFFDYQLESVDQLLERLKGTRHQAKTPVAKELMHDFALNELMLSTLRSADLNGLPSPSDVIPKVEDSDA